MFWYSAGASHRDHRCASVVPLLLSCRAISKARQGIGTTDAHRWTARHGSQPTICPAYLDDALARLGVRSRSALTKPSGRMAISCACGKQWLFARTCAPAHPAAGRLPSQPGGHRIPTDRSWGRCRDALPPTLGRRRRRAIGYEPGVLTVTPANEHGPSHSFLTAGFRRETRTRSRRGNVPRMTISMSRKSSM